MATIRLPADFRDFLKLLNSHRVDYLLVGGYAVCFHGYYRNTGDMDFWIAIHPENAARMVAVIREFGFATPELEDRLFLEKGKIIRLGVEPLRIGILTEISGCDFAECFGRRVETQIDGLPVNLISLPDLLQNKRQAGRLKDLNDAKELSAEGSEA
jgi:predicted nucleotidyltransferase